MRGIEFDSKNEKINCWSIKIVNYNAMDLFWIIKI